MDIWHRVSIAGKDAAYWQSRGLKMTPILSALDAEGRPKSWIAEITESDTRWLELKPYVEGRLNFINTFFSEEERLSAEWCILRGTGPLRPLEPVGGIGAVIITKANARYAVSAGGKLLPSMWPGSRG